MPSIDERVVAMSFENAKFEANVATTMSTLGKLDSAIKSIGSTNNLDNLEKSADKVTLQGPMSALDKLKAKFSNAGQGAAEGFSDIDRAADKVTLEGPEKAVDKLQQKLGTVRAGDAFSDMEGEADKIDFHGLQSAIEGISGKFSTLKTAAAVALGNIESTAISTGARVAKSFTFEPIMAGFHNYETQINAVQTILANTGLTGKKGLDQVNGALGNLNKYANLTVYNFSEMAKNIGTFTAAGVKLGPAVDSIKGIANLAALSGSNSQQASTAMYQLSQAIAAGKVGLQDWNSVVNAGMGGAVFQKALMRTGEAMGTISKGAVQIDKATGRATISGQSFRESISAKPGQKSWLTSDVLTKTLGQFTGDMSAAQLAAEGFNASQIKAIQAQAKTAVNAATQIKTFSQLTDALKEEVGTAWANVFKILFGDINQATKLFSGLHTFMENALTGPVNNFAKILAEWAKLGGRKDLLDGLKSAFNDLEAVMKPIHDAFQAIFPPETAKGLLSLSKGFKALVDQLKIGPQTADNLQQTFQGLFAVLHIGITLIEDLAKVAEHLFGVVGKGSGGFLAITAAIGSFLTNLDNAISKGHALDGFFSGLQAVLSVPLGILGALASAFFGLFDGLSSDKAKGVEDSIGGVGEKLSPIKKLLDEATGAWHGFISVLDNVKTAVDPLLNNVANVLGNFATTLANGIKNTDFSVVFSAINTTLLGGIFLALKKGLTGKGVNLDLGGGLLGNLSKTFEALTGNLEAMQKNVQAKTLLTIAAAVGVLAASVVAISLIDPKKIASSMTAIAVGLGELSATLALLSKAAKGAGMASLPIVAASMVALSVAILILAGAMKVMSTMSWEGLTKGLVGVGGAIAAVAVSMKLMGGGASMVLQAAGLTLIAVALTVLAGAMKIFASMKWSEIGKGLVGIAGGLVAIGIGLTAIGPMIDLVAPGLVVTALAVTLLSGAIQSFGKMNLGQMAIGIGGIATAIGAIGLAVSLIPPTVALQAAGLILVAVAITGIAGAIKVLGAMDLVSIIKGITALAGVFLVLAVGLDAMATTLPGSVALLAAAAAIAVLAPALALLGNLSWSAIFKGIAAVALALGTIAIVGVVAAPALAAIGIALIPLGAGFILVAEAANLFAQAMSTLGEAGPKAVAVMIASLTGFLAILPTIVINFLKGMVDIAQSISQIAPQVLLAFGGMIDALIAFVITESPKLATAISALITAILKVFVDNGPNIVHAGLKLLNDLLDGIDQNIGGITTKVADIIAKFLDALSHSANKLVTAGVNLLVALMNGVASKFDLLTTTADNMIGKFVLAVAKHAADMSTIAANMILTFISGITGSVHLIIDKAASLILAVISGLGSNMHKVVDKGADVLISFISGIGTNMNKIANKGADAVISFLNGIADTIRSKGPDLRAAGYNVASALLDGMWQGIDDLGWKIVDKLGAFVKLLPSAAKKLLGIKSPSTVFADIGTNTMLGFQQGMEDNSSGVTDAMDNVSNTIIDGVKTVFGIHSPSEVMKDIGKQINEGFKQGLEGSSDDVLNAFKDLNDKLVDSIDDTKSDMSDAHKKVEDLEEQHAQKLADIAKLKSAKKPDKDALAQAYKDAQDLEKQIMDETTAISKDEDALNSYRNARALLTDGMQDEENQLISLKGQYDDTTKKLDDATQALNDATQARDDAKASLTEKYDTTPTIDDDSTTKVADYTKALTAQVAATKKYTDTLAKLRAAGLDDQTYQKLLDEGTAGQDFANQLLIGGKDAIANINDLDSQLLDASKQLAQNAADQLYQAGVDAAQGLVDGLTAQKAALQQQMTDLANWMVAAIKQQLGIKSPSRVLMEVGKFAAQGVIKGLAGSSQAVSEAAASVGDDAVSGMSDSLSKISDVMNAEIDPTITPVLDLTQVKKDAQQLNDLTNVVPITAAASFGQASSVSQEVSTTQQAVADAAAKAVPSVNFTQNNTSPESLSEIEIYRQTNNQLSKLKSVVGLG